MGDVFFGDNVHGDKVMGDKIVHGARAGRRRPERAVVLVMSANADHHRPLRLDEEHREIVQAIRLAGADDRIEVRTATALRLDDLQNELLRHRPVIAHFGGHGTAGTGIVVSDETGQARTVPPRALSNLFGLLHGLRCVVLNACFTDEQAEAVAGHVPYVIGMHGRVPDDTAIRFAVGFYQGIAHGLPARDAFAAGRNRLDLHGHADTDVPRLLARADAPDSPGIGRRHS